MFHSLPPSAEEEARRTIARFAVKAPPRASIEGLMDLGGGVAFRIVSPELDSLRRQLAEDFFGLLSAQDGNDWRPHVTIQNKVAPKEARLLIASLERSFRPRPLEIKGLGLHRYLGGPWQTIATHSFRGR
jgi:hypothetical protein